MSYRCSSSDPSSESGSYEENEYDECSDWDKERLYTRVRELLEEVEMLNAALRKYEMRDLCE